MLSVKKSWKCRKHTESSGLGRKKKEERKDAELDSQQRNAGPRLHLQRLAGKAPALRMVKSGCPKFASSSSVGLQGRAVRGVEW